MVEIDVQLNDIFVIENQGQRNEIRVTRLTTAVEFVISGDNVIEPERPRRMPVALFAVWMQAENAQLMR